MNYVNRTIRTLSALPLAMLLLATTAQAADADTRVTVTTQGTAAERSSGGVAESSRDEYAALTTGGKRSASSRAASQQKSGAAPSRTPNTDFWFYDADVELFADIDRDGYYSGIDLIFDADTSYAVADVYAVIYLSYEYGEWNEYAETEVFTIFGAVGTDEYRVETDLVSGYPTGNYDILIELFDTFDNSFVASFGPEDTSELSILPLEDIERDTPPGGTTQVVVNSGGGGSLGWMLLLGLAAIGGARSKRA